MHQKSVPRWNPDEDEAPANGRGERLETVSFDIEDPKGSRASNRPSEANAIVAVAQPNGVSGMFPMRPFKFFPAVVQGLLPGTWIVIQDTTHLALLLGCVCTAVLGLLALLGIAHILSGGARLYFKRLFVQIPIVLLVLPLSRYFKQLIEQFDDRMVNKQNAVNQQKELLASKYNDFLADMDSLLTKSMESSSGFAEKSFESKRRDFQRFLERAKGKFPDLTAGVKSDTDFLTKEFRRFVTNWLKVFEECSIDPVEHPKLVVTQDDERFQVLGTIPEICDYILERLKVTEVRFVSVQREKDTAILKKNRKEIRRLTKFAIEDMQAEMQYATAESIISLSKPKLGLSDEEYQQRSAWLQFGMGHGCRLESVDGDDGYPKALNMNCARIVILSREHSLLLIAFVSFWGLAVGASVTYMWAEASLLLATELAVTRVLSAFQEIDIVQQLEREVKSLEAANKSVKEQNELMKEFWGNVQNLSDLWLHRTIPRLEVMKEMTAHLEDCSHNSSGSKDLINSLALANDHVQDLEHSLPALPAWRQDGGLSEDQKKAFGTKVSKCSQESTMSDLLRALELVTNQGALTLKENEEKQISINPNALSLGAFGAPSPSGSYKSSQG